jgi:hypothetical protein
VRCCPRQLILCSLAFLWSLIWLCFSVFLSGFQPSHGDGSRRGPPNTAFGGRIFWKNHPLPALGESVTRPDPLRVRDSPRAKAVSSWQSRLFDAAMPRQPFLRGPVDSVRRFVTTITPTTSTTTTGFGWWCAVLPHGVHPKRSLHRLGQNSASATACAARKIASATGSWPRPTGCLRLHLPGKTASRTAVTWGRANNNRGATLPESGLQPGWCSPTPCQRAWH